MDSDDFPAEAHAALDLLDQRLSSLRRQLVALQKPAAQAAMQRMQAVRVPGYRGPSGQQRRGGGFTPRGSGGLTPRGTPRSGVGGGSLYRDSSLGKRRRAQVHAARNPPFPCATVSCLRLAPLLFWRHSAHPVPLSVTLPGVHAMLPLLQEYDVGELVTPLGAPKFVERPQVKTIDTPRVRVLPNTELKKRQAAIDQYELLLRQGECGRAGSK
jgi:hypothetical protein